MLIARAAGIATGVTLGIGVLTAIVWGRREIEMVTIPAGTTFVAALERDLSNDTKSSDDEFELRTVTPVRLKGGMEIPEGSEITGKVIDGPEGELRVRFTELVFSEDSTEVEIRTDEFRFGTLQPVANDHLVVPAGQRLTIRLSRPVTVAYRSPPEPIRAAE